MPLFLSTTPLNTDFLLELIVPLVINFNRKPQSGNKATDTLNLLLKFSKNRIKIDSPISSKSWHLCSWSIEKRKTTFGERSVYHCISHSHSFESLRWPWIVGYFLDCGFIKRVNQDEDLTDDQFCQFPKLKIKRIPLAATKSAVDEGLPRFFRIDIFFITIILVWTAGTI